MIPLAAISMGELILAVLVLVVGFLLIRRGGS